MLFRTCAIDVLSVKRGKTVEAGETEKRNVSLCVCIAISHDHVKGECERKGMFRGGICHECKYDQLPRLTEQPATRVASGATKQQ